MMKRLLFSAFTILCAFFTFAQETTSEIQGTISDGKAGLAGATIKAFHNPSGTSYTTTSRKDGRFNLPNLRIGGPYTITVTYVGYGEEKQDNVILLLGQVFRADFTLNNTSSQLKEIVVVAARQDRVFNNGHTGSQEIISRSQIEKLPTVSRSLQDFTKLTPTATNGGLAFAGQSSQYNNVTVDGANFNNSFGLSGTLGGQAQAQPISLDAIEQIQVSVSPYDVRQGGFSGGGINTVTRSGTNQFKGSVYAYTRNNGMLGYHVETNTVPRQSLSYSLRGGSLGGPILKNKVFFFVNYEQERRKDPGTIFIASDANHAPNGTTVSNANADTLNRLRQYLITNYQYDPGDFQGYTYRTQSDKVTAKVDWNLSHQHTLTFKYNYLSSFQDEPASNSGSSNPNYGRAAGQYAMPFYKSGYTIHNNFNIYLVELNSRFSNNMSNKLQIGYTALRDYRVALSDRNFPMVDILDGNKNPYTTFGYELYTYGNKLNTDIYQFSDIFTLYKGNHEITLGTQDSWKKYQNGFSPNYDGTFRFASLSDFYNNKPPTNYSLSYTLTKDGSFPLVGPQDIELGFFAQDKWRITPNFTLVYGLRVDQASFKNNFLYNPVVDTLAQFRDAIHANTAQAPKSSPLFSPRIGFNWDIFGDHKTQVRGGAGYFSGPPPFVWISNQASNSGVALFGSVGVTGAAAAAYPFNPNPGAYIPPNPSSGLASSYSINVTDPKFKFPQALKTSLAIDQKLPDNWVVTLEGTYSKDVNAVYFENINLPSSGVALAGPGDGRIRYSGTKIYPTSGTGSINNPSIGNAIYMTNTNAGFAYTATLQVQKNFRNLYLNIAYTYSKSKDVMVGGSTAATMWGSMPVAGDPNKPTAGLSNYYLPHRVIASASYHIEYGHHYSTSVGMIFEAAPAGTSSFVYGGDLNNDGNSANDLMYIPTTQDIATYVANGQLEASSPTAGVADPRTPAQIGAQLNNFINQDKYLSRHRGETAQRNALVYPWFKRMDLNVTQDVYFFTGRGNDKTKHTLRFTMDLLNVGNFLNRNWGSYKVPYVTTPLNFDKMKADGKTPIFSMPFQDGVNQIPYTNSFKDNLTTSPTAQSRWQMQIGVRYLFN
jgi:hypothetical protein